MSEKTFDILSDDLESTYPSLAKWRKAMKNAGFTSEQIVEHFKQQAALQMQQRATLSKQRSPESTTRKRERQSGEDQDDTELNQDEEPPTKKIKLDQRDKEEIIKDAIKEWQDLKAEKDDATKPVKQQYDEAVSGHKQQYEAAIAEFKRKYEESISEFKKKYEELVQHSKLTYDEQMGGIIERFDSKIDNLREEIFHNKHDVMVCKDCLEICEKCPGGCDGPLCECCGVECEGGECYDCFCKTCAEDEKIMKECCGSMLCRKNGCYSWHGKYICAHRLYI